MNKMEYNFFDLIESLILGRGRRRDKLNNEDMFNCPYFKANFDCVINNKPLFFAELGLKHKNCVHFKLASLFNENRRKN